jgi:hypothetical protein
MGRVVFGCARESGARWVCGALGVVEVGIGVGAPFWRGGCASWIGGRSYCTHGSVGIPHPHVVLGAQGFDVV